MAELGSFGDVVFSVSENTVLTFKDMKWKMSAKYATHDRHILKDISEFLGTELESVNFAMVFSAFYGVNPIKELEKLRIILQNGLACRLVIGGEVYGDYKWVLTDLSSELTHFDNYGNCLSISVQVTLKEYPKR